MSVSRREIQCIAAYRGRLNGELLFAVVTGAMSILRSGRTSGRKTRSVEAKVGRGIVWLESGCLSFPKGFTGYLFSAQAEPWGELPVAMKLVVDQQLLTLPVSELTLRTISIAIVSPEDLEHATMVANN